MSRLVRNTAIPACLLIAVAASTSPTALAQGSAPDEPRLEEIVVTAQMREESLADVPISLSAFGQDELSTKHVINAQDLAITPGVSGYTGSSFVNSMSIRGISTNDFGVGSEPSIAYYQNGVFLGRTGAALTRYYDMERVEVLRGPQGSLFGRNASAGVLHAITAKAAPDATFGYVKVGAGERGIANVEAAANFPLSDTWALRLAGFSSQEDGWVDNEFNGDELLGHDASGVRTTLGYLGDRLEASFVVAYEERQQGSNIYAFIDPENGEPVLGDAWSVFQDAAANYGGERDDTEQTFLTLTLDYDLSNSTLTSITGYRSYEFDYAEDFDASEYSLYDYVQINEGDYFSQEFRLLSNGEGPFNWAFIVSGYWEDLDSTIFVGASEDALCGLFLAGDPEVPCTAVFEPIFGVPWPGYASNGYVEPGFVDGDYSGYSAFAELSYHLSDQWEITGGVRYSYDERKFDINSPGPDSALGMFFLLYTFTSDGAIEGDKDWTDVSPRLVLKYRPNDQTTAYISASKGYKAGGFDSFSPELGPGEPPFSQVSPGTSPASYDAEEVWSYEAGLKTRLFEDRVGASIAAYFFDYDDLQFLTVTDTGNFVVRNAGQVDGNGLEAEIDAVFNRYVSAYVGLAWSDTETGEVSLGACLEPDGNNCVGNQLPNNPDFSAYISTTATLPTTFGDLFLIVEYNYEDKVFSNLENTQVLGSRKIANVRAGIGHDDWQFTLYVENIGDEDYFNEIAPNFLFAFDNGYAPNRPRTFGAEFQYKFGDRD